MPIHTQDSQIDPELVSAKYRIGRSIFFDVETNISEAIGSNIKDNGSLTAALNLEANPIRVSSSGVVYFSGGGDYTYGGTGCPYEGDFLWIEKNNKPFPVRAKTLFDKSTNYLYNPITTNFNLITGLEIIKDAPIVRILTSLASIAHVSATHKIIENTAKLNGLALPNLSPDSELLSFFIKKIKGRFTNNIFSDTLYKIIPLGIGDAIEIQLESEHIYVSGASRNRGVLGHNRKDITKDGEPGFEEYQV